MDFCVVGRSFKILVSIWVLNMSVRYLKMEIDREVERFMRVVKKFYRIIYII